MTDRLGAGPPALAGQRTAALPSVRPGRRVIAVLLASTAALDLARCGAALAAAGHSGPTAGLVVSGLATAGVSLGAAGAWHLRQRWPAWAALAVAAACGPQAAAFTLRSPFAVLDAATAVLGIVLAVTVLATAGQSGAMAPAAEGPAASMTHAARRSGASR